MELVDTRDLKSLDSDIVPVQVRPRVPSLKELIMKNFKNSNHKLKYAYVLVLEGVQQKIILKTQFIAKKIKEHDKLRKYIDQ